MEPTGIAGIAIGAVASAIAVLARIKQSKLESTVALAGVATTARIDETKAVMDAWKEVSEQNRAATMDVKEELKIVKTELKIEQEHRHTCEIELAELRGKIDVLMGVQKLQIQTTQLQDVRNDERMNRQDERQTVRHELQDVRQDEQDTEVSRIGTELQTVHDEAVEQHKTTNGDEPK